MSLFGSLKKAAKKVASKTPVKGAIKSVVQAVKNPSLSNIAKAGIATSPLGITASIAKKVLPKSVVNTATKLAKNPLVQSAAKAGIGLLPGGGTIVAGIDTAQQVEKTIKQGKKVLGQVVKGVKSANKLSDLTRTATGSKKNLTGLIQEVSHEDYPVDNRNLVSSDNVVVPDVVPVIEDKKPSGFFHREITPVQIPRKDNMNDTLSLALATLDEDTGEMIMPKKITSGDILGKFLFGLK